MPMYEYLCEGCGEKFELIQKFVDTPLTVHEKCGSPVHRLISAAALQFKGSGFYINDYARSGSKSEGKSEGKPESNGGSGKPESNGSGEKAKSESKAESKSDSSSSSSTSDSSTSSSTTSSSSKKE